jgi:polar amino acid transport system substrate-binding protein
MLRFSSKVLLIAVLGISSCGEPSTMSNVRSELAPSGKVRVGINFGNALLASNEGGQQGGITVDLARELARRLSAELEIVSFQSAARLAEGASEGVWQVAFLASDPARAGEIAFTTPYLEIDATYLVASGSPIKAMADVDRPGVRVAVSERSAYDLFLTRTVQHASLVRAPGVDPSVDLYFKEKLDTLAGLRPLLLQLAQDEPGLRVLDERFMSVGQAIGTLKNKPAAADYLQQFVDDIRKSGLLREIVEKNGIQGVTIPLQ